MPLNPGNDGDEGKELVDTMKQAMLEWMEQAMMDVVGAGDDGCGWIMCWRCC